MGATGIDGGIDGGNAAGGGPPVVPPPPPLLGALSDYDQAVVDADLEIQALLGSAPMIYQTGAGLSVPVTGVFDAAYVLERDEESGVETTAPAVFLIVADLPSDPYADDPILSIQGVTYEVIERKTGGLGAIVLVLRKTVA